MLDAIELVIGTRDTEAARRRWQRLFDPLMPAESLTWRPAVGPAITLAAGAGEQVDHLLLTVRSVDTALQAWSEAAQPQLAQFPLRFAGPG